MRYDIPNCKYYVTEEGRLFDKITNIEFIPKLIKKGYINIKINKKLHRLHRIVAEAFIPNPEHKPYVDHINRNRLDNRVVNLRWVTPRENSNNAYTNNPIGERKIDFVDEKTYKRAEGKKLYHKNREKELLKKKLWYQEHKEEYNRIRREKRKLNSMPTTPSSRDTSI